jgi:hypothetical protein
MPDLMKSDLMKSDLMVGPLKDEAFTIIIYYIYEIQTQNFT